MDTNTSSIAEYTYWDAMEGDALVCSPFGQSDYRGLCFFYRYVIGVVLLTQGVWVLRVIKILERHRHRVVPDKFSASLNHSRTRYHHLYLLAITLFSDGLEHLIGGAGTVYSSSTVLGLTSDFMFAIFCATVMYHHLLQRRLAENFRKLVQCPGARLQKQAWTTRALDLAQSFGALPVTCSLWVLLVFGVWSRSDYHSAAVLAITCVGIRTVLHTISARVRTLSRVDELQQKARGGTEAKIRRRGILMGKIRAAVFDMVLSINFSVLLPLSLVVFGSIKSSTRYLLHRSVFEILWVGAVGVIASSINRTAVRRLNPRPGHRSSTPKTLGQQADTDQEYTVANDSGLSVVEQSVAEVTGRTRTESSKVGLFSVVTSTSGAAMSEI
jgi:hypothetical protein